MDEDREGVILAAWDTANYNEENQANVPLVFKNFISAEIKDFEGVLKTWSNMHTIGKLV